MIRQLALALALAAPLATIEVTPAFAHTPPTATTAAATYTVRPGDALASIARDLGVKLADLLALNDLTISSTIHPGRILTVPVGQSVVPATTSPAAPSSPGAAATAPTSPYTVKAGDALFLIARRHGLTLAALLAANSFTSTTTIVPGQVIRIPATAVVPAPAAAPTSGPTKSTSAAIDTLVTYLREQVGKPYKFFTAGPDTFDCSGLVVAGYRQIGVTLPHQSRMQATIGTAVDLSNESIKAGDLIFMVSSVDPTRIGHVGIALDADTWIQAVGTGIPVRIRPIPSSDRISAVRRILET
ncbi:MAG TPA: LysM peptidoglycan-binding domain-containing protein [Ilumatobacteraceae bacterium]|nr:LysM peptidoglycan-binding domain-containing protein [Ilumatobacteraceae bacterium]HRB03952.1 LysM peptidoglycan-binding domain-containing protein [Ilumatobacteraceae bacterium]